MSAATRVLLMAGGRGARMAAGDPTTPKPLARVGSRSLIEHLVERLVAAGFSAIDVALGHRAAEVEAHLRASPSSAGAHLRYRVEREPRGTIGALADLDDRHGADGESVLVVNADLFTAFDFRAFLAFHRERGAHRDTSTTNRRSGPSPSLTRPWVPPGRL